MQYSESQSLLPYKGTSHYASSKRRYLIRLISIVALSLSNGIVGFANGFTSPTETELIRPGLFSTFTFSIFSSLTLFGLSSLVIGPFAAKLSNKFMLIITSLLGGFGWFLIILGHDIYSMIIGRFLTGIQIGACVTLTTIFMDEISSKENRNFDTAVILTSSGFCIFLTYLIGSFLSYRWLGICVLMVLVTQTILLILCPSSPNWLIHAGYVREARKTLLHINGDNFDANKEIEKIQSVFITSSQRPRNSCLSDVTQWDILKPILIACGLQFFKGFSGQPMFYSYAASLFSRTGLNSNISSLPYPILMTVGTVISALLAKRVSRKKLLISTTVMQGVANLSFFLYFLITRHTQHCSQPFSSIDCSLLSLWPVLNLSTYSFFYAIGWGTISWSMFADSFDPNYKEVSAGIVTFWYTIIVTIIVLVFPNFVSLFGDWPFFLLLTIECFLALCFEYIFF